MKQLCPNIVTGLAVALLGLVDASAHAAGPGSLALTPGDSGEFGNGGQLGGWGWAYAGADFQFHVEAPTQVTALAYYQLPAAMPLKRSIVVSIERIEGGVAVETVASAIVGPSAQVDHVSINVDFLFTQISPVELQPGNAYQVTEAFVPMNDYIDNSFFYAVNAVTPGPSVALEGPSRFGGNFYVQTSVFGDLDGDGVVDSADLGLLLLYFGPCEDGCGGADLDGSGEVDSGDLGLLLLSYT